MTCKEAEKMIPLFLTDKLNNRELSHFLMHVENCGECMEELTIQYLVMIGTSLIEDGKSFDLRKALNELISNADTKIRRWKIYMLLSYFAEIITIVVMIIILIVVIFV